MNKFFNGYADLTALILTATFPLLLTVYLKAKAKKNIRAVPVYFFVFGPLGILSFIFFHLFENSYRAVDAAVDGHFKYDFRFYSLILFGLIVAYLGTLYLKACIAKCVGKQNANRTYFFKVLLLLLVTAPVIPLTPIAAVPSVCCSVSVVAFLFVCRRKLSHSGNKQTGTAYKKLEQPQVAGDLFQKESSTV